MDEQILGGQAQRGGRLGEERFPLQVGGHVGPVEIGPQRAEPVQCGTERAHRGARVESVTVMARGDLVGVTGTVSQPDEGVDQQLEGEFVLPQRRRPLRRPEIPFRLGGGAAAHRALAPYACLEALQRMVNELGAGRAEPGRLSGTGPPAQSTGRETDLLDDRRRRGEPLDDQFHLTHRLTAPGPGRPARQGLAQPGVHAEQDLVDRLLALVAPTRRPFDSGTVPAVVASPAQRYARKVTQGGSDEGEEGGERDRLLRGGDGGEIHHEVLPRHGGGTRRETRSHHIGLENRGPQKERS